MERTSVNSLWPLFSSCHILTLKAKVRKFAYERSGPRAARLGDSCVRNNHSPAIFPSLTRLEQKINEEGAMGLTIGCLIRLRFLL